MTSGATGVRVNGNSPASMKFSRACGTLNASAGMPKNTINAEILMV